MLKTPSGNIAKIFRAYRNGLFLVLLLIVYCFLDYPHILFLHPQGIHFIRQTDCLSFVRYYSNHGMSFFEPGVFNLSSRDGKAACEFPILYYLTALFYKLIGEHEFILRLINITMVSFGFFCLFRLLTLLLKDIFYSFVFTFLFFSSTILIYYTDNYLPDASALACALAGWYYSYLYFLQRNKTRSLFAGFMFFALSSLLKVTFFINPFTFLISLLVFDFLSTKQAINSFKSNFRLILYFTVTLALVIAWNLFAIHYNSLNHDSYFLLSTRPIWGLDKAGINSVFDYIYNYWYSQYYYQSTIHVFAILIIIGLFLIRYSERIILLFTSILLSGSLAYFVLFFDQFRNHDYYFIALMPSIIFLIISSFISVSNRFPGFVKNLVVRSALLLLCILSLNYAREKMVQRYDTKNDLFSVIGVKLSGTREYLNEKGVPGNEKVILVTDLTPNGGLYFLDHPGWNLRDTSGLSMQYLRNYMTEGAGIIILTDRNYLQNSELVKCLGKKIGEKNQIMVFKTAKHPIP